jgi:hypothetical protein
MGKDIICRDDTGRAMFGQNIVRHGVTKETVYGLNAIGRCQCRYVFRWINAKNSVLRTLMNGSI